MGYPVSVEKQAAAATGALLAAAIEAVVAPGTALLWRISDLASGVPRPVAMAVSVALLTLLAAISQSYVRPLSRKAALATGFCVVAVFALFIP